MSMAVEIAKKRGRPRKVIIPEIPDGTSTSKPCAPTKSTKQTPVSTTPTGKKSTGIKSKSKVTGKEAQRPIPESGLKTKPARPASPKIKSEREIEVPPPEVGVLEALARKESSHILQRIAALKVEEVLKEKAAGTSTTLPPSPPPSPELPLISIPNPTTPSIPESTSQPESYTIPSRQSSTMPSTLTPPSTYYQWLPNPAILTRPHAPFSRSLSSTTRLSQQEPYDKETLDRMRNAKSLNRLATEASIPRAKRGLNPGGFPVSYQSATRRVTAIIVAAPVALCMSWFLYERCEFALSFFFFWGVLGNVGNE